MIINYLFPQIKRLKEEIKYLNTKINLLTKEVEHYKDLYLSEVNKYNNTKQSFTALQLEVETLERKYNLCLNAYEELRRNEVTYKQSVVHMEARQNELKYEANNIRAERDELRLKIALFRKSKEDVAKILFPELILLPKYEEELYKEFKKSKNRYDDSCDFIGEQQGE